MYCVLLLISILTNVLQTMPIDHVFPSETGPLKAAISSGIGLSVFDIIENHALNMKFDYVDSALNAGVMAVSGATACLLAKRIKGGLEGTVKARQKEINSMGKRIASNAALATSASMVLPLTLTGMAIISDNEMTVPVQIAKNLVLMSAVTSAASVLVDGVEIAVNSVKGYIPKKTSTGLAVISVNSTTSAT
jgi:hypothetical protein